MNNRVPRLLAFGAFALLLGVPAEAGLSLGLANAAAKQGSKLFKKSEDAAAPATPAAGGTATRPSYNTGNGFFVLNGKLYDANGNEFRMRGVDRLHYDSNSQAGIAGSGANAVRVFVETGFGATVPQLVNIMQTDHINRKQVPIPTSPSAPSGTQTSCSSDPAVLSSVTANWVATAADWTALNRYAIINIANEWGPSNSAAWRDSYISAIASMRAAGYLGALMVDAGGCGQDLDDLVNYSAAVFNSDPQRNIVFALHAYGTVNDYSGQIAIVAKGNPTVVQLMGASTCHPFAPGYCPSLGQNNTYSGISAFEISGAQGMTQINGMQPSPTNVGGASGAWTLILSADSAGWSNYTGGATAVDYDGNYALRVARLAALASATGAAYAVTEFGPGRNIGPSPTLVTPLQIVAAAEASGLGWLAWAWDDNNLAGGQTDNDWFGMTYHAGVYNPSADLTMFGQQIVEGCLNPAPGGCGCPDTPAPALTVVEPGCAGTPAPQYSPYALKTSAKRASIFP